MAMKNGAPLVLAATFGLALKGIWARFAYAEGLDVAGVLFYRSAFSAPLVLFGGLYLMKKERLVSNNSLSWRDYGPGIALGALFSVGMKCDFEAIERLGASVSRVILFAFPLVVLILDASATGRMPERKRLAGFLLAWLGLLLVAVGQSSSIERQLDDLPWALASMGLYALFVWASGKVTQTLGSVRLTMSSNLATAAVVLLFVLGTHSGAAPVASNSALAWILVMVFVSTVAPYFLMTEGIKRLGATDASLLAMSGPLVTLVAGFILLGESLTSMQLLGTAVTILGVGVSQGRWKRMSAENRPLVPGHS